VALAEETISLAEKYDFPYWVAWETGLLGWARAMLGHEEDGVEMLHKGLAAYRATGAELFCSYMLGLLAQLSLRAKRFGEALSLCQEALASGARADVHFFDAELYRMKGECLFGGEGDLAAAETCFEQAVAVARGQGARMLELRGAIALASLRRCQGRSGESHTLLSEALALFGADRAAPDVERARRLLAECGDEARHH
jgi:predicted ATPase